MGKRLNFFCLAPMIETRLYLIKTMKPAIKATLIFPLVIASIAFFVWFVATHETFVLLTFVPALLLVSAGLIWYALYIGFGGKKP